MAGSSLRMLRVSLVFWEWAMLALLPNWSLRRLVVPVCSGDGDTLFCGTPLMESV